MDYLMLMGSSAVDALVIISNPMRLAFLLGGVVIGLILGVIPGLGGLVGMALLLPFTFDMDKFAAFAFLLGMGSVTTTSDTIPAVLFGVPGTTGSAATVLMGLSLGPRALYLQHLCCRLPPLGEVPAPGSGERRPEDKLRSGMGAHWRRRVGLSPLTRFAGAPPEGEY